eukprot:Polyplicarium_translucidae@DN3495_c0_g1_i1.p1
MKAPQAYNMRPPVEASLKALLERNLRLLAEHEMICLTPRETDGLLALQSTPLGKVMAQCCVQFDTMRHLQESVHDPTAASDDAPQRWDAQQCITVLSRCQEFVPFAPRMHERRALRATASDPRLAWKLKGAIGSAERKAQVLVQAALGRAKLDSWQLQADQNAIVRAMERVAACALEVSTCRNNGEALCSFLRVSRNLRHRVWDESQWETTQIPGVGEVTAAKLAGANLGTLSS